jgi:hypothetical protein
LGYALNCHLPGTRQVIGDGRLEFLLKPTDIKNPDYFHKVDD